MRVQARYWERTLLIGAQARTSRAGELQARCGQGDVGIEVRGRGDGASGCLQLVFGPINPHE